MHNLKSFFVFLFTLFCIGFTLGTATLVFIVGSYIAYTRQSGWLVQYENYVVCTIILICLVYSFAISSWVHHLLKTQATKNTKRISYLFLSIITALSLVYWFVPSLHPGNNSLSLTSSDGRFHVGPYPEKNTMQLLKNQGYTAIISLLSPDVLPFEPVLMKQEASHAEEVGIKLINIPMVPWVSNNVEAYKKIMSLVQKNDGEKYYVHCYYGRDRVYMFMHIVDPATHQSIAYVGLEQKDFGIFLDQHLMIAPRLTSEELGTYIINNEENHFKAPVSWIIYIHPTNDPSPYYDSLASYGIKTTSLIFDRFPYDSNALLDLAKQIKNNNGSVLVYSFHSDKGQLTLAQDGLFMSYLTNLPSLPRQLFSQSPMSNGPTTVIAPNIVLGPQPTKSEIESYLYTVGVRKMIYLGSCKDSAYLQDQAVAQQNNLSEICYSDANLQNLFKMLSHDGPWYVYGPSLNQSTVSLTKQFIHLLPVVTPPKEIVK